MIARAAWWKRSGAWLLVAGACAGCTKGPASQHSIPNVPVAGATVASTPIAPATSASPEAPPVAAHTAKCDAFPAGFRGSVFGLPVLARLTREGSRVRGRYFYEKIGVDIALAGTLSPDGTLRLAEGPTESPSGRFEGACNAATGALTGIWTSPNGRPGPFALAPITPTFPPVVATKRWTRKTAKYDFKETKLEFFGLPSLAAERAIGGAELDAKPGPWFFATDFPTEEGGSGEYGETVTRMERELINVARGGTMYMTGAAHPINGMGLAWVTYDFRTGQPVTRADVFTRDPKALVVACAAKGPAGGAMGEGQDPSDVWSNAIDTAMFTLEETGIQFYATGFPHAWGNLDGTGPRLPYNVLLRDGYLRADSAVARAWAGIAVAPAGEAACAPGRESTWWQDPWAETAGK